MPISYEISFFMTNLSGKHALKIRSPKTLAYVKIKLSEMVPHKHRYTAFTCLCEACVERTDSILAYLYSWNSHYMMTVIKWHCERASIKSDMSWDRQSITGFAVVVFKVAYDDDSVYFYNA